VPGGTYANLIGFYAARHWKFPHVRQDGWNPEDRPVAFCPV
jgi:glutamate/tyrosine decarboxylase-like PLP-dependent enzyme